MIARKSSRALTTFMLFVLVDNLFALPIVDAESKFVLPGAGLVIGGANRRGLVFAVLATK